MRRPLLDFDEDSGSKKEVPVRSRFDADFSMTSDSSNGQIISLPYCRVNSFNGFTSLSSRSSPILEFETILILFCPLEGFSLNKDVNKWGDPRI